MGTDGTRIAAMPRGGPNACWLDRLLQTNRLEYTDRYDIDDDVKQKVIRVLDRAGERLGQHDQFARTALQCVADIPNPRILELGAGHGKLSARILDLHPSVTVTVSDLDPTSVANIAAGALGRQERASTQVIDATDIHADDDSYDLVIFAQAFHHLPPQLAAQAIAEATRVGRRLLVVDLKRMRPSVMVLSVALAPLAVAAAMSSTLRPVLHDGWISTLRAYSHDAFIALGQAADPDMGIEFLPTSRYSALNATNVVFTRPRPPSPTRTTTKGTRPRHV